MSKKKSGVKTFFKVVFSLVLICFVVAVAFGVWLWQIDMPAGSADDGQKTFLVESGEPVRTIGERLERDGVVKSQVGFFFLAKLTGGDSIQAGKYSLSPSMKTSEIIKVLSSGGMPTETVDITFLPGGDKFMAREALREAGFDEVQIDGLNDEAFAREIRSKYPKLFDGWSFDKGLEGYYWGDTYEILLDNGTKGAVNKALAQMDKVVTDDLVDGLSKDGMNFYENLILASIIAREESNFDNQKIVAQIFLNRLEIGMPLGSDPTYIYGAKLMGVEAATDLDSPYNTRKVTGLTPTPIATPSLNALRALAEPTPTDALFFLSDDEDILRTATTDEEHQWNIVHYCQVKCFE
ncbi:MAG: endolytic transglycosylase MltG [Candidatus Nomurabacteria bacterium]|nr:endolytic transglycosylase MltG [Candidatus Nomurabacteria bacterium]